MENNNVFDLSIYLEQLQDIAYNFNSYNYVVAADLANKMLIKYSNFKDIDENMNEIRNYKKLCDDELYEISNANQEKVNKNK